MVRTKVFVGNLDFQTKESELAKEFSNAGKVISANIITRGPRSLGYGFVEMESEEDAQKAVELMNKKEIDGRAINVEVAKIREEVPQQQQQAQPGKEQTESDASRGRGGSRGGRGRGRGAPRGTRGAARGGAAPRGTRGAPRGTRGGRGGRGGAVNYAPTQQAQANATANTTAPVKQEDPRTPSKTTLFVANLPFSLDDEGFGKILKDNTLAFKAAHVVRNVRSQRSKGFGFIEFDNEQDQQKALAGLNGKQVEGRDLVVKVALTELKTEEKKDTTAPAQTK